jgi:hypothetical protein
VAFAVKAASAAASGGQTAQLAVLHHRLADPVDARIAANGLVERIDKDDLVVLVGSILQAYK